MRNFDQPTPPPWIKPRKTWRTPKTQQCESQQWRSANRYQSLETDDEDEELYVPEPKQKPSKLSRKSERGKQGDRTSKSTDSKKPKKSKKPNAKPNQKSETATETIQLQKVKDNAMQGYYLPGNIGTTKILVLLDSGCTRTVLSK